VRLHVHGERYAAITVVVEAEGSVAPGGATA
jgi:hypothetical protein